MTWLQKFVHKRTKTGTILVVADALRPLAPPVVYTWTGCKQRYLWVQGNMEGSTRGSTDRQCTLNTHPHSASYQPVTYQPVSYTVYSATIACTLVQVCVVYIYIYIYIYKGTEREDSKFASFLVQFSSFWKKGIVTFSFSSLVRSWMPGCIYISWIPYLPLYNARPCIIRTPKFQTKFFFVLLNKGLRV